ncbi:MAG: hypothetical protein mread185_000026 [Mycoplasmataceae bacterium]|nr:MAG: hypothetical protein mread185_000026 [Mycoplasmataceae bacterium]
MIIIGTALFSQKKIKPENSKELAKIIIQPTHKHTASVIFLHGLGDNIENHQTIFKSLQKNILTSNSLFHKLLKYLLVWMEDC